MQLDTIARVEGLIRMTQPTSGDDVYSHDPAARILSSYRKEAVPLPDDVGEARDFTTLGCEACRLLAGGRRPDVAGPSGGEAESDRPWFQSVQRSHIGKYVGFIELLRSRHTIRFGTWRREGLTPSLCGRRSGKR